MKKKKKFRNYKSHRSNYIAKHKENSKNYKSSVPKKIPEKEFQLMIDKTQYDLSNGKSSRGNLIKDEKITLDDWQERAVQALLEGKNIVIDAPTSAGKTKVIESFFSNNIHNKSFRACYTCQ